MNYRKMPGSNEELSVLGFGCMRFPLTAEGKIEREASEEMLLCAVDRGVNYIDTAWPYHSGESEPFVGDVLYRKGLRKKVKLATKLPSWLIKSREDMDHYLEEQFKRLKTDYIDYYLVHALNRGYWKNLKENGIFDFLDCVKRDGRVKNIGFSFHDDLDLFKEITDSYEWDFCQIQYNYLDVKYQAGREGLDYAAARDIGVIVMEPLRGGKIAGKHPAQVQRILDGLDKPYSNAEWALRWVWDHKKVVTLLSGMSTKEQVEENIKVASDIDEEGLDSREREAIDEIRKIYLSKIQAHCTECKYCMPCPSGVNIPRVFKFYNEAHIFGDIKKSRDEYRRFIGEKEQAHNCIKCGKCEKLCPQNIEIIKHLKAASELLED